MKQQTRRSRRKIFDEARAVLVAEPESDFSLEDLARRLSTSPRQLQRAFAENPGISFREYRARVRMTKAARLLAATDIEIADVARAVGYGTRGQFSRAFCRFHGTTPDRYRRGAGRAGARSANRPSAPASRPGRLANLSAG